VVLFNSSIKTMDSGVVLIIIGISVAGRFNTSYVDIVYRWFYLTHLLRRWILVSYLL